MQNVPSGTHEDREAIGKYDAEAARWYRYESGDGVMQDKDEAVKWYRKAAEQGHGPAMECLEGLKKNGSQIGASQYN